MTELAQREQTASERFMNKVVALYNDDVGELDLTNHQKRLAQNYFIGTDVALKGAEERRLKKTEKYRDSVAVTWNNVNMDKLARDVVAMARIGYDPALPNHINMIPFKNNNTEQYDITFIEGYRGIELKSTKYGLDTPDSIVIELVYSTDKFKSIKKDRNNPHDTYEFEITNEFDRGEIIGGFYYHVYYDRPNKNKLVVMNMKDIEKRKPKFASVEFWGGEKDKWENGQKVGKEQVEGWFEKMVYKTIFRSAWGDITIDSQKIDDDYMQLKKIESSFADYEAEKEIKENANGEYIDVEYEEKKDPAPEEPKTENKAPEDPKEENFDDAFPETNENGPNF
jgi:recombination protein RecT